MRDDRAELERFCADSYPSLVRAVTLLTGDPDAAEDAVQDAMLAACRKWGRVRRLESPAGWVYRVATNSATSRYRRRANERRMRERLAALPAGRTQCDDPVDRVMIEQALARLRPRQRDALILRYLLDLPVRAVADLLGGSEGSIRVLTHRAAAQLRDDLGEVPIGRMPNGR